MTMTNVEFGVPPKIEHYAYNLAYQPLKIQVIVFEDMDQYNPNYTCSIHVYLLMMLVNYHR